MENEPCKNLPALTLFNYGDGEPPEWGVKYVGHSDDETLATFGTKEDAKALIAECNRIDSGGNSELEAFLAECRRILANDFEEERHANTRLPAPDRRLR